MKKLKIGLLIGALISVLFAGITYAVSTPLTNYNFGVVTEDGVQITSGASVQIYTVDTSSAPTIYADASGNTELTNPINIADGINFFAAANLVDVVVADSSATTQVRQEDVTPLIHRIVFPLLLTRSEEITTTTLNVTTSTTADSYATPVGVTWTPTADMTAGGSNGIYIQSLVNEDVQNVYGHRSRIDLRSAAGTIATNQLHAFDGLINLDNGAMTVIDNISAVGVAVYSVGITAGDITVAGGGYGSFNGMRVLWHAEEDFTIETNGLLIETGASSNCDYGINVYNDGTMDAGIWLHNNPAGGDTMVSDLKLSSGARVFTGSAANGNAVYAEVGAVDATGSIYITTAGALYVQVANTGAETDWYKVTTTNAD